MLRYLRGWVEAEVMGAAPEQGLNRLAAKGIPFWALKRQDEFTVWLRMYRAHAEQAERELSRAHCACRILHVGGIRHDLRGLKARPVLVAGLVLSLILTWAAQTRIWFLRVEGCDRISPERVLRELADEGIRFGTWGPGLDSGAIRNRMLNRIPELRWLAVNRSGCVATIPVAERTETVPVEEEGGAANVVAARDGVITELRVLNGFAVAAPGDAVRKGDLLVSGLADWTTHTQVTRANAEAYARTLRHFEARIPAEYGKKTYTGRVEICRILIFQSFRRKISGNSSIFGTSCDKIAETNLLTLPGGYVLPIGMETVTLREYTLTPQRLTAEEAEEILRAAAEAETIREMTAGQIQSAEYTMRQAEQSYSGLAELSCSELISRTVPILLPGEDESSGKSNQRRTN